MTAAAPATIDDAVTWILAAVAGRQVTRPAPGAGYAAVFAALVAVVVAGYVIGGTSDE